MRYYRIKETYNISKEIYNISQKTYNISKEAYNISKETCNYECQQEALEASIISITRHSKYHDA
jgi:hypothetical protein